MLGLYLHVPFCQGKCPYCDFYSVVAEPAVLDAYPALLRQQLERACASGWTGPVDTVYFGGGTPSLLSAEAIAGLLTAIDRRLGLSSQAEISLEANPGTVSAAGLRGLRSAGVNRLSLGVQTLDDTQLQQLGRQHDRQAGLDAVRCARSAGFTNLSLDLMFALPGQDDARLAAELQAYLDLAPEHLSCYGLTAEAGTPFAAAVARGELSLPDADRYAEAFLQLHAGLTAAGYRHYEIANYARPDRECRHNLTYWRRLPYLGLGAGAHSFRGDGWGSRWAVPADLGRFQQVVQGGVDPAVCLERFDAQGALAEVLYLGLRLADGVADADLVDRFGRGLTEAYPEAAARLTPWLSNTSGRWTLSVEGWLLYDRLIATFL